MPRYDIYYWLNLFSMSLVVFFLVILLLYLVVTPLGIEEPVRSTPFASSLPKSAGFEDDLSVGLMSSGVLIYRDRVISRAQLIQLFRTKASKYGPPRIFAETGTPYRFVRVVVRLAREAGIRQLTFMCRPKESPFPAEQMFE